MRAQGLRDALANPDFVRVWLTGVCAGVMRWLEVLAIGVYTLEQTGSAFMVALMYFARTMPTLISGPLVGALGERVPRKPLYLAGLATMFTVAGALAVLSLSGLIELWHIAVGAVIAGTMWSMEHTVRRTIARDVVPTASVGNAISLDTGSQNATRMIGPLAGGLLMAVLGLSGAFVLGVIFYGVAIALMLSVRSRLPPTASASDAGEGLWVSLRSGVRYALAHRLLTAVLAVTLVLNFFGFPYISMVPVIGKDDLGLESGAIGLMASAEGLGAVLGAFGLAMGVRARDYPRWFALGSLVFIAAMQLFAQSGALWPASAALLLAGIGLGFFAAMQSTILLTAAEPAMRGRVMGLLVVTIGAGPFGVLTIGALAESMGAAQALSLMSGAGLALLILSFVCWPELLKPLADD